MAAVKRRCKFSVFIMLLKITLQYYDFAKKEKKTEKIKEKKVFEIEN